MEHQDMPPPAQMMQMISGFWVSCAIYAAARLNLADALAEGPKTPEQLAAETGAHAPSLYRLLRALTGVGVFYRNAQGAFANTPLGTTLRDGVPGSMKAMALAQLGDHFRAWGSLTESVKTGEIAFDAVEGMDIWKYYQTHPEEGVNFMKAMTGLTQAVIMNVLPAYDFSGFKTIVDMGGGNGALLMAVLKAAPKAAGIVFDEDYVVRETAKKLMADGFAGRCDVKAGSLFDSAPEGADAYLIKFVLHDWTDAQCTVILKNIAKAMHSGSKLLVLESVVPAGDEQHPSKWMDLNMLAMTGGRERTEKEYAELLAAAGLKLNRVVHTHSPMISLVEAVKA